MTRFAVPVVLLFLSASVYAADDAQTKPVVVASAETQTITLPALGDEPTEAKKADMGLFGKTLLVVGAAAVAYYAIKSEDDDKTGWRQDNTPNPFPAP